MYSDLTPDLSRMFGGILVPNHRVLEIFQPRGHRDMQVDILVLTFVMQVGFWSRSQGTSSASLVAPLYLGRISSSAEISLVLIPVRFQKHLPPVMHSNRSRGASMLVATSERCWGESGPG